MDHLLDKIVAPLAAFILGVIAALGYGGIVLCMTIESACIPLPSEIIMPFSGYLVTTGRFTLWGITLAGAVGNVFGSWIAYWLGMKGGRPLAEGLARWKIIRIEEYDRADGWLKKHGLKVAFWSRLLPIVRTFISFPAGSARVDFKKFTLYTFLGSLPWCLGLGYVGVYFGENWESIREYWRKFDLVVVVGILVLFGIWLRHHFRSEPKRAEERDAQEDRPAV
ncbi:MAG TPA: DedA family protein [Candidatus Eisenbacteria bacterium]|nr:DedA family protein [Candidatus Eisenbacteria bacterium]